MEYSTRDNVFSSHPPRHKPVPARQQGWGGTTAACGRSTEAHSQLRRSTKLECSEPVITGCTNYTSSLTFHSWVLTGGGVGLAKHSLLQEGHAACPRHVTGRTLHSVAVESGCLGQTLK